MKLTDYQATLIQELEAFIGNKKHPNITLAMDSIKNADCANYNANSSEIVNQIEFYSRNSDLSSLVKLNTFAKLAGAK